MKTFLLFLLVCSTSAALSASNLTDGMAEGKTSMSSSMVPQNPILPPTAFIPDGEPHVFEYQGVKRVFLYGSRDERGDGFCGFGHDAWSAPVDALGEWTNHGEIFHVKQVQALGYGLVDKQHFGAPDCAYNPVTRKYYLYTFLGARYALDGKQGPRPDAPGTVPGCDDFGPKCVMASSDSPAGPFLNPVMCDWPPANKDGAFDPAVLVDDQEDGSVRVYAYWGMGRGGNGGDRCAELDPADMHTIINPQTRRPDRTAWHKTLPEKTQINGSTLFEANSIRKLGQDRYAFIYSANERIPALTYCYGRTPLGPWSYGGRIIENGGGNNHGSICRIGDQWYVFYHRQTAGGFANRQAMMEPIAVRFEGARIVIPQVEMTSQASSTNGLPAFQRYNIGICCEAKGGGRILGWPRQPDGLHPMTGIKAGSCLGFKYFNFGPTAWRDGDDIRLRFNLKLLQPATLTLQVARPEVSNDITSRVDVAKVRLQDYAADGAYHEINIPLSSLDHAAELQAIGGLKGKLAVYLHFDGGAGELCCIRELEFARGAAPTPPTRQEVCLPATAGAIAANLRPAATNGVNWESFLRRQDPVWELLPARWIEGAFIGNGRLGAMIYKGAGEKEPGAEVLAWTIGRSDLYDERDLSYKDNNWVAHSRLPLGRFHLCPAGKVLDGNMRIDLWNGEALGTIRTDQGSIHWRSWVQTPTAGPEVVVVDVTTEAGERNMQWNWQPFQSIVTRYHSSPRTANDYPPNPPGQQMQAGAATVWVQPLLAGGDYATAWQTVSPTPDRQVLYVAVGDGLFKGGAKETALAAVAEATKRPATLLQTDNRAWWHAFYPKSFLSVPDGRIESHYWIQMYKLASATRPGGVVVDTCGPWLKVDTVWPACWWNLNVQLTHYPIPVANHLELNDPLIKLFQQELANGNLITNAPPEMRHDSAYFGNPTTTKNLINRDVYWNGKNLSGRTRPGARLNHLPWICHTFWEHYRRTMDDTFLREFLFPLTRRAYSFIFHFVEEGADGKLHIKDTYSSEYGAADDANEALAMVRWGGGALVWMCERLHIADPDLPRWKDILARLVEPPVDANGLMIGSDVPFVVPHRHYSHLMALVPFRTWDFQDPATRKLAFHSLAYFLRGGRLAGYSYTGASSMYAMLGDGDQALHCLETYLKQYDKPNTMYVEGNSPVMETPPSAARCVQDMLLQSHDVIRIFPAVPGQWQEAAFENLLAEGAFEVSAVRKGGKTQFVRIKSLAGEPCRVQTTLETPARLSPTGQTKLKTDAKGITTLDLTRGEEATLISDGFAGDLVIQPLELPPGAGNYYGLKKR